MSKLLTIDMKPETHDKLSTIDMEPNDDSILKKALKDISKTTKRKRIRAFANLNSVLSRTVLRKRALRKLQPICDEIKSSLAFGNCEKEQKLAAELAPKLALQLGGSGTIIESLGPLLLKAVEDERFVPMVRAQCSVSLALLKRMCPGDKASLDASMLRAMLAMEKIFADAYENTAGTEAKPEASRVPYTALNAWSLLVSMIPAADLCSMMYNEVQGFLSMKRLIGLLESPNHKVRPAAAAAIGLVFEMGRQNEKQFMEKYLPAVNYAMLPLVGRALEQDYIFEMLLRYVNDVRAPLVIFEFDNGEFPLLTWTNFCLVYAFVGNLGISIDVHLRGNKFLKSILKI